MCIPNTTRHDALAAYRSRQRGSLASVRKDAVVSVLDKVRSPLRIRRVTFQVGAKKLYLVIPDTAFDHWAGLIIPGQTQVEVGMWHRGEPYARALSDRDGMALFSRVVAGPVRFVYRPQNVRDPEVEVQTEWVLIP